MEIIDALKETGKATGYHMPQGWYVATDEEGVLWLYDEFEEPMSRVSLVEALKTDYEPYPDKKEIRPEKVGELWEKEGVRYFTQGSNRWLTSEHGASGSIDDLSMIHNKNGWKRLHPPVEDENVERIEIENVSWIERDEGYTYPITFGDSSHPNLMWKDLTRKPPMKMTLEYQRMKNELV